MNPVGLPDAFFTASPRWGWLIVSYFFVGGIAGGCYFLAALLDFFGLRRDRPLARVGYYVALAGIVVSGLLLTLDLSRPLRFWHMLIASNTARPMFKWWSPMSVGSWALLAFGVFALVSVLAALAETARLPRALTVFRSPHPVGVAWTIVGGLLGFFVAGYTGVLLSVTNRPLWSQTDLLGLTFLLSSASTAAAVLVLAAHRQGRPPAEAHPLTRLDAWVLVAELVAVVALVVSVGRAAPAIWLSAWGVLLAVGVVLLGIVVPLVLELRPRPGRFAGAVTAAILVLVGGFLLRVVIVFGTGAVRLV